MCSKPGVVVLRVVVTEQSQHKMSEDEDYEFNRREPVEPPFKRMKVACYINSQDGSVSVSGSELRDDLSDCSDDEPSEKMRHYKLISDLLEGAIKEGSDAAKKATGDLEDVANNALVIRKGMRAKAKKREIETKMKSIVASPSQVARWTRKLKTEFVTDPLNHLGIELMIKEKPILYNCKCWCCGKHYEYKDSFGDGDLNLLIDHIMNSHTCKALSNRSSMRRDVEDDYPYKKSPYKEKPFPLDFFRLTRMRDNINAHKDTLAYMYWQMSENEGSKTLMNVEIEKKTYGFKTFFSQRSVGVEVQSFIDCYAKTERCGVIYKEDHPALFEDTVESHENLCEKVFETFAEFAASISICCK